MNKIKIGVIFGGMSTENEVSCISGASVIKHLNKEKYNVFPIYIDKIGNWYKVKLEDIEKSEELENKEHIENITEYLKGLNAKRKIAVLGDMFELGEYSKELHEKVGVEVYKNNIDILICNGENAKNIIKSAEKCGMNKENIYYFEDKKQVQEFVESKWEKGDVILFKASNGMKFFDIVSNLEKA